MLRSFKLAIFFAVFLSITASNILAAVCSEYLTADLNGHELLAATSLGTQRPQAQYDALFRDIGQGNYSGLCLMGAAELSKVVQDAYRRLRSKQLQDENFVTLSFLWSLVADLNERGVRYESIDPVDIFMRDGSLHPLIEDKFGYNTGRHGLAPLNAKQREKFLRRLKGLPHSEKVFFLVRFEADAQNTASHLAGNEYFSNYFFQFPHDEPHHHRATTYSSIFWSEKENAFILPSFGALDAYRDASQFDDEPFVLRAQWGFNSTRSVARTVRDGRILGLAFPEIQSPEEADGLMGRLGCSLHDCVHAHDMIHVLAPLRKIYGRFAELLDDYLAEHSDDFYSHEFVFRDQKGFENVSVLVRGRMEPLMKKLTDFDQFNSPYIAYPEWSEERLAHTKQDPIALHRSIAQAIYDDFHSESAPSVRYSEKEGRYTTPLVLLTLDMMRSPESYRGFGVDPELLLNELEERIALVGIIRHSTLRE